MAIRHWHWGQLLVLWLASAFVWGVLAIINRALTPRPLVGDFLIDPSLRDPPPNDFLVLIVLVVLVVLPAVPLVVTWRWFAGRRKDNAP